MTTDRWPKHGAPRRAAVRWVGAALRAGEGRGHDLSLLRHDALLHPDRRGDRRGHARPAAASRGRALVRAHLRRRAALHQRLGVLHRQRRGRSRGRAGRRRRARVRRGARRAAAPARARDRRRRRGRRARRAARGARLGRGGGPGRARRGKLAAREVRTARRRPELGPDPRGRRPGRARRGSRRARPLHRGRPGGERQAAPSRSTTAGAGGSTRSCPRRRSSCGSICRAGGEEAEIFFCDLGHGYVSLNSEYST